MPFRKTVFRKSIRIIAILFLLTGCGKSMFSPSGTDNTVINPELSLERANYLYLGGSTEEADEIYLALIEAWAGNEENSELYYNAIRGHSKCTLDGGEQDSADVLESFFSFVQAVNIETFTLDAEGQSAQEAFETSGASFKGIAWNSFTILLDIPPAHRTEGDYCNMSISGLFAVCVDFLILMATAVDATTNIMEKMTELSTQAGEFIDSWTEAESNYGTDPAAWPAEIQNTIQDMAVSVDALFTETSGTLTAVNETMELLLTESEQVTSETADAENTITLMLNDVFNVIFEIVDMTLTVYNNLQSGAGEFYNDLITAIGW